MVSENGPYLSQSGIYDHSMTDFETNSNFNQVLMPSQSLSSTLKNQTIQQQTFMSLPNDQSLPPLPPIRSPGSNLTLRRYQSQSRENNSTSSNKVQTQTNPIKLENDHQLNGVRFEGQKLNETDKVSTPLKLDLRNHSTLRFDEENIDYFNQSKAQNTNFGPALPPLASKLSTQS